MTTQLLMPLSATPAPAVRSSDTSVAAARAIQPHLGRLEAQVLYQFKNSAAMFGEGRTCDQIEQLSGLSHQCASARIRHLVLLGKIKDSGRRLKTRSGRPAAVWIVA